MSADGARPDETKTQTPSDAATPPEGASPRALFGALFDTVLEEIDRNPDFAERLSARLGGALTVVVSGKAARGRREAPAALLALDARAALEEHGQIGLRDQLSGYTNAELAAAIRARRWSTEPVSKLNKTQLLNTIIRAARTAEI